MNLRPIDKLILALLLGLGAFLRFLELGRALGGGDENQVLLEFVYSPLKYILTTYAHGRGGHHIFHTVAQHLMASVFGEDNAAAIRFPAFMAGIATLWILFKLAYRLTNSLPVAFVALLAGVVNPVHIYYSQTARGYSFMVFFSTLAVYSAVRLLESRHAADFKWWLALALSCFLSIYTIPTNMLFVFSLAVWTFLVLHIPRLGEQFDLQTVMRARQIRFFAGAFLSAALLSVLAYMPVIPQMAGSANDYFLAMKPYRTRTDLLVNLLPDIFSTVFEGPGKWFIPVLLVGLAIGNVSRRAYRALALSVLLIPYLIGLATDISWKARIYLFNFPLFMIYFAIGLDTVSRHAVSILRFPGREKIIFGGLVLMFAGVSLKVVFVDLYPGLKMPDGILYRETLRKNTNPFDLLMVENPGNYLYARTVYKEYLRNILSQNKLSGIKAVVDDPAKVEKYAIERGGVGMPIFSGVSSGGSLRVLDATGGRSLVSINSEGGFPVLPDDYEADVRWHAVSGKGKVSRDTDVRILGNAAIKLEAGPDADFVVFAIFPEIVEVARDCFAVLTWAGRNLNGSTVVNHPEMAFINPNVPGKSHQLPIGEVNDGIKVFLKSGGEKSSANWLAISNIAKMQAGPYSLTVWLRVPAGNTVVYDGLRFFVIEPA